MSAFAGFVYPGVNVSRAAVQVGKIKQDGSEEERGESEEQRPGEGLLLQVGGK